MIKQSHTICLVWRFLCGKCEAIEIEREKDQVKDDMRKEIIEVATEIAGRFVVMSISEKQQQEIVEETIEAMGDDIWLS